MLPAQEIYDVAYMRLVNIKYFANFLLGDSLVGKMSNFKNLTVGQFSCGTFHAPVVPVGPMSSSVKHILAMGTPTKISKKVVGRIPVKMTTLQPWRARTDEYLKNKPIDQPVEMFIIPAQCHRKAVFAGGGAKNSYGYGTQDRFYPYNPPSIAVNRLLAPVRPYSALVGNFVSRELRNSFPDFRGTVKVVISHCETLLQRVGLWLEPLRCSRTFAACFIYSNLP